MKILWENSHRKKNWGSFVHRGLRYDFLRKKIWTVLLILQFNIRSSIQKVPKTAPSRGSLGYLRCYMHIWCRFVPTSCVKTSAQFLGGWNLNFQEIPMPFLLLLQLELLSNISKSKPALPSASIRRAGGKSCHRLISVSDQSLIGTSQNNSIFVLTIR